jgi:hypothetical protein
MTPPKKYPLRLPETLSPILYTVSIKPDFYSGNASGFMFYGHGSVLVYCKQNTDDIFMHAVDLQIPGMYTCICGIHEGNVKM